MAGILKAQIKIQSSGLGEEFTIDRGEQTLEVPVEHGGKGRYIIHKTATTAALQFSNLFPQADLTKVYLVYIKAEVGTIYVKLNTAGIATFDETTAHLALIAAKGGEEPINVNPDSNAGITIDASAVTDAFTITYWESA